MKIRLIVTIVALGLAWAVEPATQALLNQAQALAAQARQSNLAPSPDAEVWKSAIAKAEEAAKLEPQAPEVLLVLGNLYTETKWWARAEEVWREYVKLEGLSNNDVRSKVSLVQLNLGYAAYQRGDYGEALVKFQNAAEYNPSEAQAYEWLGRIYLEQGNSAKARENWRRAVEIKPTQVNRYFLNLSQDVNVYGAKAVRAFYLGYDAYAAGNRPDALQAFSEAAQAAPNWLEAKRWLARAQLENGNPGQALTLWREINSLPQASASDRYQLKIAELSAQHGSEAAMAYLQGVSNFEQGNKPAAKPLFQQAVAARPEFVMAWYWLGRTAYDLKDYAMAEWAYGEVVRMEPSNAQAKYWLTQARKAQGK